MESSGYYSGTEATHALYGLLISRIKNLLKYTDKNRVVYKNRGGYLFLPIFKESLREKGP